jgi:hypothetical protein
MKMKRKTTIAEIGMTGYQLADTQLRQIAGGLPSNKCTEPSASMTNPGEIDTATDTHTD